MQNTPEGPGSALFLGLIKSILILYPVLFFAPLLDRKAGSALRGMYYLAWWCALLFFRKPLGNVQWFSYLQTVEKSFFEEKHVEKYHFSFFVFIDTYRTRPGTGKTCSLHVTPSSYSTVLPAWESMRTHYYRLQYSTHTAPGAGISIYGSSE